MNSLFIQIPNFGRSWGRGLSWGEKLGKSWRKTRENWENLGNHMTTFIWDRGLCVQTERVKFRIQIDQLWMSVGLDPWPSQAWELQLGCGDYVWPVQRWLVDLRPKVCQKSGESIWIIPNIGCLLVWQLLSRKLTYGKSPFSSSMDFPIKSQPCLILRKPTDSFANMISSLHVIDLSNL